LLIAGEETGAVLRDEEIGQAFQFGKETAVRNVLEPNWWESTEAQDEAKVYAEEALRLDIERRRARERDDDNEDEKVEEGKEKEVIRTIMEGEKKKVVARTRVRHLVLVYGYQR
jgi:ATP-dependent DNA helicase 2 subunit 1